MSTNRDPLTATCCVAVTSSRLSDKSASSPTTLGGSLSTVMFVLVSPSCSKTPIKHCRGVGDRTGERRDVYLACKDLMPTATTGVGCLRVSERES
jgi:hypothetical protein